MRLWIISDLHLDVNRRHPFTLPSPRPQHDAVIIAGDICEGIVNGVRWIAGTGLDRQPVLYVPGNHEFYGFDRIEELAAGRAAAAQHANIHVLDRDALDIGGVLFLGATLWTDYKLLGEVYAALHASACERGMNDHHQIRNGSRAWRARDAAAEHDLSRQWIAHQLDGRGTRPAVVVTHHAPSLTSCAERYRRDIISCGFASDCEMLASRAALWVHGHCHSPSDYTLEDCRVIANPRGYVSHGEAAAFDPALVVEVESSPARATR